MRGTNFDNKHTPHISRDSYNIINIILKAQDARAEATLPSCV